MTDRDRVDRPEWSCVLSCAVSERRGWLHELQHASVHVLFIVSAISRLAGGACNRISDGKEGERQRRGEGKEG